MAAIRRVSVVIDLAEAYVHHHHVYAGIQRYAHAAGTWQCSLTPYFAETSGGRVGARADGIVGRVDTSVARAARSAGIPAVNVWLNSPVRSVPSVHWDARGSGRMAAEHLVSRGFTRFGYLGFSDDRGSDLALASFRERVGTGRTGCSTLLVRRRDKMLDSPARWTSFQAKLDRWIEGWTLPLGVLAHHDELCRYLAEACRRHHLNVPEDVALVGRANEPVLTCSPDLSLSSVDLGFDRIGYRAAELLDALMDGKPAPNNPIVVPPTSLIVRRSSDAFAVANPLVARALRFIAANSSNGITVADVAAHVQTGERTLARLFAAHAPRSAHSMITLMQVEHAKRLLAFSDTTIKSVARQSGFRSANHICEVFRRMEGKSPREFQRTRAVEETPRNGPRPSRGLRVCSNGLKT